MWSMLLTLKTVISYTHYASFKVGQFIVSTFHLLWTYNVSLMKKLVYLITIIIEDFTIFVSDVVENIHTIIRFISYVGECIAAGVTGIVSGLHQFLELICDSVLTLYNGGVNGIFTTTNVIKNIFLFLKRTVIMFGDGVWFLIIYIPKSVISLIPLTFLYVADLLFQVLDALYNKLVQFHNFIVSSFRDCYHFLTDVPAESLIGILIAVCFIYIFLQFYSILFMYFRNVVFSFLNVLRLKYRQLKSVFCRIRLFNKDVHLEMQEPVVGTKSTADSSCVICQEYEKCILVLPCKHLCLCINCTPRLMRYTGRCPICRRRINSTMKIFT